MNAIQQNCISHQKHQLDNIQNLLTLSILYLRIIPHIFHNYTLRKSINSLFFLQFFLKRVCEQSHPINRTRSDFVIEFNFPVQIKLLFVYLIFYEEIA